MKQYNSRFAIVSLLITALLYSLSCAIDTTRPALPAAGLEFIRVSKDGTHFIRAQSGTRFIAWGFNYDHDDSGRLIEDYWHKEWPTVVEDFGEMKDLGANVVRIHLQTAKFMSTATKTNKASFAQLARLVKLAEQTGLYLDITGLGCYHKKDVPKWYDAMDEAERWNTQTIFWEAVAKTCAKSPSIFCYDLMNEPILPGEKKKETDWLAGEFAGKHFVQRITLNLAGRTRKQVAKAWVDKLVPAIRRHDNRRMITVGVIPWVHTFPKAKPLFYTNEVAENLDFASVHFYPKKGEVEKALTALSAYDIGKPLVIEEMFPLHCNMKELTAFIDASRSFTDGYIGFYWGKTIDQYNEKSDIPSAITKSWLKYFAEAPAQKSPKNISTTAEVLPRVFCLNPVILVKSRARLNAGNKYLQPALRTLRLEADDALKQGPFSVRYKKMTPPSGDKHDYMSRGSYWWPDPTKPDGLPYIRRDGLRNPETITDNFDRLALGEMTSAVQTLATAFYFTNHEPYAVHASMLLRTWFLDPATKMNPNLQFGQAIPGITEGRDIGIIDTARFVRIIDAIGLLESSPAWTAKDQNQMRDWCTQYLKWLRTSKHGLGEEKKLNNHGTWYDAQVVSLALYTAQNDLARKILELVKTRRIDKQIEPDGKQPHELARTKSLGYSTGNLDGFFRLATMADKLDIDLWHYESPDGRSIKKALDFLAQHVETGQKWPYKQITRQSPASLFSLLRRASIAYSDDKYEAIINKIPPDDIIDSRTNLLWPHPLNPHSPHLSFLHFDLIHYFYLPSPPSQTIILSDTRYDLRNCL
ncbi:MAG: alginate lyase family protein [Planctomycetota bacterium]